MRWVLTLYYINSNYFNSHSLQRQSRLCSEHPLMSADIFVIKNIAKIILLQTDILYVII